MTAPTERRGLSDRQRALLAYTVDYVDEHGYPPTVREIGDAIGMSSTSSVHRHLQILDVLGLLRVNASSARAIDVRPARAAGHGSAVRT